MEMKIGSICPEDGMRKWEVVLSRTLRWPEVGSKSSKMDVPKIEK